MGYSRSKVILVTWHGYVMKPGGAEPGWTIPDVAVFRESLPEEWRPLVIGPVRSVVNDEWSAAFLWDGSKDGWDTAEQGDEYRQRFYDMFAPLIYEEDEGSSPADILRVSFRWGGDEPGAGDEPELMAVSNAHKAALHGNKRINESSLTWFLEQMEKQEQQQKQQQKQSHAFNEGYTTAIQEIREHFGIGTDDGPAPDENEEDRLMVQGLGEYDPATGWAATDDWLKD
jgi:hypothetical protein